MSPWSLSAIKVVIQIGSWICLSTSLVQIPLIAYVIFNYGKKIEKSGLIMISGLFILFLMQIFPSLVFLGFIKVTENSFISTLGLIFIVVLILVSFHI